MNGAVLRRKRISAEIPGALIATRTGISRGRLSEIERGLVCPTREEADHLNRVLDELIAAREKVAAEAERVGYPF
jgi:transcriptional regulator with XRE-family HTH domain